MEELITSERAKAREKAIEKIKQLFGEEDLKYLFPEFIENENEKIRKAIGYAIGQSTHSDGTLIDGVSSEEALAWLEEQGEQKPTESKKNYCDIDPHFGKPIDFKAENFYVSKVDGKIHDMTYNTADKVESKFKVGDWVVNNEDGTVGQITNIHRYWDGSYGYDNTNGCFHGRFEEDYHLWTIADAKNGDILTGKIDGDTYILIYKQTTDGWIETYGHYYNAVNRFCALSQLFCRDYQGTFTPASKEQRNLLFSKMKETGYKWDVEKKELIKVKQKTIEWSKEDEIGLNDALWAIEQAKTIAKDENDMGNLWYAENWLKSIKTHVQPK